MASLSPDFIPARNRFGRNCFPRFAHFLLGVMRKRLIILFSSAAVCNFALAHVDRGARPESITVSLKSGETVTFTISDETVTALRVRIGKSVHSVPQSECAKLHDIRFDSVMLLWNGSYKSSTAADYFYIEFYMGSEPEKAFGQLPRIRLLFRSGKFSEASIEKKTAEDTWQRSRP